MDDYSINSALQRNIKSGNSYNKYFEKVECKPTYIGKGSTKFGLEQMREIALKYQYQTKQLAKVLNKSTLQETIESVYNFVYDHFQYEIDGYKQQLRSPSCSWQQRKTGIDCKSYSILVSTILLNLNIEHYFRRIKQPMLNPTEWSHVYVIIPEGKQYYIIDGTIHDNVEVPYLKKDDLLMKTDLPYYALNAAVATNATNQFTEWNDFEVMKGFNELIGVLEKIGISDTSIDFVYKKTQEAYYKYGSFSFPFRLINKETLQIDNQLIRLKAETGLGAAATGGSGMDWASIAQQFGGTFSGGDGANGEVVDIATNAIASLAVDPSGMTSLMTLASGFMQSMEIQANIQKVLKYGLSSWGSSTSPEEQQEHITNEVNYVLGIFKTMNDSNITDVINEAERAITYGHQSYEHSIARRSWADATVAGWEAHIAAMKQLRADTVDKVIGDLTRSGVQHTYEMISEPEQDLEDLYRSRISASNTTAEKNGNITYKKYTFLALKKADGSITSSNGEASGSNMNTVLGIGAAAVLAGFLVVPMMGKNNPATSKKTTKSKKN